MNANALARSHDMGNMSVDDEDITRLQSSVPDIRSIQPYYSIPRDHCNCTQANRASGGKNSLLLYSKFMLLGQRHNSSIVDTFEVRVVHVSVLLRTRGGIDSHATVLI